jgi:hypothetical protein
MGLLGCWSKKELRKLQNGFIVSPAAIGFERSNGAVLVRTLSARIDKGSVFSKAKVVLTNFRLARQFNRILFNSGFFTPFAAASDAIESTPTWASCTVNIGWHSPMQQASRTWLRYRTTIKD